MKIALVGYGKMGKIIDDIATGKGHEIVARLRETPTPESLNGAEVAIEFSHPEAAFENIQVCLQNQVPVVCGTTGWLQHRAEVEKLAAECGTAFLYGSNFSLGVNLFFALNEKLAAMMKQFAQYQVQLEEIHHTAKKDAPSGTAITLAEGIISQDPRFEAWKLEETKENELGIFALREEDVPGTHTVSYRSAEDEIEIKHTAYSRQGFAAGAVLAAEWLKGRRGVFTMKDVLGEAFS
ncbi:4-hydroxy-tetrahydrodipicolinate reductase [Chryseobacterium salipaludis]|uniref:4-hydroxy-tetrahydrodipicolinate reductase n=1 Tax=Chryseobacterium TaxID=59732 RepID=UPI000E9D5A62|nr:MULTISPECIES: 4-hydroxy-tetrahydrodipicolinate reductase [Chryseobacterium]MCJ8498107.1 4-hydroxy-tetrahydrodipicolinate reductase [Chryseobacterium salipaludis]MCX3296694.1 4-hydroxy-tetrahydrodipicolinate reductase [Planobacterium sp. JC490]HAV02482.1 4-hydroxy-tetrahydrodipicolinate reductase [Chryseobacterium sp.]